MKRAMYAVSALTFVLAFSAAGSGNVPAVLMLWVVSTCALLVAATSSERQDSLARVKRHRLDKW